MTEGKCKDCRFYAEGKCHVPLWINGQYTEQTAVQENGHCELFEVHNVQ